MGTITSNVGLATGLDITGTVDQLMQIASVPRDLLISRTEGLQSEQLAINSLSTRLLAFQYEVDQLNLDSIFQSRVTSTSDDSLLTATVAEDATPAISNYIFTPIRTATYQQLVSQRYESETDPVGAGSFTFRTGGFVDQGLSLDELNDGQGIDRGEIRITDKSGASAVIDLSYALDVDDVLDAINNNTDISVTAQAVGDAIRLTDNTGSGGTLSVAEVGSGTTAASLGLDGFSTSGTSATGDDVLALHDSTRLSLLNDSNGVQIRDSLDDLEISLADGSSLLVNLDGAVSLGDVLDTINAADETKLTAAISADGDHIELTDLTSGAETFAVSSVGGGTAAEDLGLTSSASGGVITSSRLVAGLKTSLVSSLKGGQLDALGSIQITDRSGATDTVDLSGAETVDDILELINGASIDVVASVNEARNGIVLTDTTGATASHLIVASTDATETADLLGIEVDDAVNSIDGGSLNRQTVSEATRLSSLNSGEGIDLGDFKITDSNGVVTAIDLDTKDNEAQTIGDVIDRINAKDIDVVARINDTGDGILLIDTAGGDGTMTVTEVGNGTTAADLNLLGEAVEVDLDGTPTYVIDGTTGSTVTIGEDDTLADVVETINGLDAGVTASIVNDGLGVRLLLSVDQSGAANQLMLDLGGTELEFQEISQARDAVMLYGEAQSGLSGLLLRSSDNQFDEVISGVNLEVQGASDTAVTVSLESSSTALVDAVEEMISAYNAMRKDLDTYTEFDETELTTGILFGSNDALRVETNLSRVLTDRYYGLGDVQSLEQIGISLDEEGMLELDKTKLQAAFDDDSEGLRDFFTTEETGFVATLDAMIDYLAGDDTSVLSNRSDTLQSKIDTNNERIEQYDESLESQREFLLAQFYQLELIIADLQQSQSALNALQPISPLVTSSSSG